MASGATQVRASAPTPKCAVLADWLLPEHVAYLASSLKETSDRRRAKAKAAGEPVPIAVRVLCPTSNAWTHTYDGIDICAVRVLVELFAELDRLQTEDHELVTHFSVVGYSLGGLICRHLIGLLAVRKSEWWEKVEKVQFTTFASPWIGIPKHKGTFARLARFVGSNLLSRTGRQLYLTDHHGPLPSSPDGTSSSSDMFKGDAPLIAIMCHPRSRFIQALLSFRRIVVFANAVQDPTVPYVTGAFENSNPFWEARGWVERERKRKGWRKDIGWRASEQDKEYEVEWARFVGDSAYGGTRVSVSTLLSRAMLLAHVTAPPRRETLGAEVPVIKAVRLVRRPSMPSPPPALKASLAHRFVCLLPSLRPSFFFFGAPYNYIAFICSPILVPAFLVYLMGAFSWASRKSAKRIKELEQLMDNVGQDGQINEEAEAHLVALLTPEDVFGEPADGREKRFAEVGMAVGEAVGVAGDGKGIGSGSEVRTRSRAGSLAGPALQRRRSSITAPPVQPPTLHRMMSRGGAGDTTPPLVNPFGDGGLSAGPAPGPAPPIVEENGAGSTERTTSTASEGLTIYETDRFLRPSRSGESAKASDDGGTPEYVSDPEEQEAALGRSGLTPVQLKLIEWLNGTDPLDASPPSSAGSDRGPARRLGSVVEKRLGYFDRLRNAHGALIFRKTGISDPRGRAVVNTWAEDFSYA